MGSIGDGLLLLALLGGIGWLNFRQAKRTARRLLDLAASGRRRDVEDTEETF